MSFGQNYNGIAFGLSFSFSMIYFSSLLIEEQIQFITECNSIFLFSDVGRKYLFYLCIGATVIQALFFLLNNWNKLKEPDIIMPSFLEFMNFTEQLLSECFSVLLSSVAIPRLEMWQMHSENNKGFLPDCLIV